MKLIQPPYLTSGDKVIIIAPARKVAREEIIHGINFLSAQGFEVIEGKHLYTIHHQFGGTDHERLSDIQEAINNHEIKAIVCARGGYGCTRIMDKIDTSPLIKHPKWLTGFSDNTALHFLWNKAGISSIHSTVPLLMKNEKERELANQTLIQALTGKLLDYEWKTNTQHAHQGTCEGEIIGGNLTLITNMLHTASDVNFDGKILFLEDVNEHTYHIDRMLTHLQRSDKFKNLAGLILGQFSDMKDDKSYFGYSIEELIKEKTRPDLPLATNFPSGHVKDNRALYFGKRAVLSINTNYSKIKFIS